MPVIVLDWTTGLGPNAAATLEPAVEPDSVEAAHKKTTEGLKGLTDPTILKRRVWLETEWDKYNDGSYGMEETIGGLWSWPVSAHREWWCGSKCPTNGAKRPMLPAAQVSTGRATSNWPLAQVSISASRGERGRPRVAHADCG
jgi:hypothetical protein